MDVKLRSGKLECTNDIYILFLLKDENYDIRSDGSIYTLITKTGKRSVKGIWRKIGNNHQGYVTIRYNYKYLQVHRIIYAKYGKLPLSSDLVINHIDSNPLNNDISNLELVSQSVNNYHAFKSGNKKPVIGNKKINFEIAEEIRQKKKDGAKQYELAKFYNVSVGTISEIVNNKIWTEELHG